MPFCSLLFFSGSEISLPLLEKLAKNDEFKLLGVVCQPDKPAGRDMLIKKPAPKLMAERLGIPVFQPEEPEELLKEFSGDRRPDILLTFAYGKILSESVLGLARMISVNLHASLLPKYRGASPIQAAILNGDFETGLTLIKMVKAMDTGPIIASKSIKILPGTTAGVLHDNLAELAKDFVPDELLGLMSGAVNLKEQNEAEASYCKKIFKEDGQLDFKRSAKEILQMFRAYMPWPGLWTNYNGKRLKLLDIELSDKVLPPGEVSCEGDEIFIGTSDGSLKIKQLQLEGRQSLHGNQFILGQPEFCSSSLPS